MARSGRKTVRALVISDLLAFDGTMLKPNEDQPSFVDISSNEIEQNPLLTLRDQIIAPQNINADLLICCGDFADKAHPTALRVAWTEVLKLQKAVKARKLAVTVGNHDVDSTYKYNDQDAIGFIQSLAPPFPVANARTSDHFWSRHFYLIEEPEYRVIILNSCAFHGGPDPERKCGRISSFTLQNLRKTIETTDPKPVNLLVCHHHPHKHNELKLGEYDEMVGGQDLLGILDANWIVIHGHKHHPKVCYAKGGNDSPIVFSAGSLSARLYPELANQVRNQCYLLEFPIASIDKLGLVGQFRAWDWNMGTGWVSAGIPNPKAKYSGLPAQGGFGARANCRVIASIIA